MTSSSIDHTAPASAAAFDYQFVRALLHLAKCSPTETIGIETGDDVQIRSTDGSIFEQDKLTFTKKNPFQNKSFNLWNTLDIWLDKIEDNDASIKRLILASNSNVKAGCLAHRMAEAVDNKHIGDKEGTIEEVLAKLRKQKSKNASVQAKISRVLRRQDAILKKMILKIEIADGNGSGDLANLQDELLSAIGPPSGIDATALLDSLQGWLRRVTMECWSKKTPAWISGQAYINARHAFCGIQERKRRLERPYLDVFISEESKAEAKIKKFVRHLDRIGASNEIVEQAIAEFLKFKVECSRLLREGEIVDSAWDAFFNELSQRWLPILQRGVRSNRAPKDAGYDVFDQTVNSDFRASLAGERTQEKYLTSGGYHNLSDRDEVWWHPEYEPQCAHKRKAR